MTPEGIRTASPFPISSDEELVRYVENKTHRQVRDLKIDCRGSVVLVSGRSRTYYAKQLATQAIRTAFPHARVDNGITVMAG